MQSTDSILTCVTHAIINLAIRNGAPLKQWIKGLSIVLEKEPGEILVAKLRATLLLESDFNALHKVIFGRRIVPTLESNNLIPT